MGFLRNFFQWDWNLSESEVCTKGTESEQEYTLTPYSEPCYYIDIACGENRLPPFIHQTLKLDWLPVDGRLIVVGDVHGCRNQLEELLRKVEFTPRRDCLTFVGDLVNKGPDSCGVIDIALKYGAISVRGNHDDTALSVYTNPLESLEYAENNAWATTMSENQASYLAAMPFSVSIPNLKIVLVHGGLTPGIPLAKQNLADMCKMRYLRKKWTRWEALEGWDEQCLQWADVWNGPEHVIFGHDAVRALQRKKYATGLDTGCVYGGQLSACVIPAGKILHELHQTQSSSCVPLSPRKFDPTDKRLQIEIVNVEGRNPTAGKILSE